MPDQSDVLKDPDFKTLSVKERRSVIDTLIQKGEDFKALEGSERVKLKSYLYDKYGSETKGAVASKGQSRSQPAAPPRPTLQPQGQQPQPLSLQAQASQQIAANKEGNRQARSQYGSTPWAVAT